MISRLSQVQSVSPINLCCCFCVKWIKFNFFLLRKRSLRTCLTTTQQKGYRFYLFFYVCTVDKRIIFLKKYSTSLQHRRFNYNFFFYIHFVLLFFVGSTVCLTCFSTWRHSPVSASVQYNRHIPDSPGHPPRLHPAN